MSLIITTDNMESEEIPTGETLARLYNIYDIGFQVAGEGNQPRRELVFLFELDAEKKDGTPFLISERFTASMHPKANLRAFIEGWRGEPYSDDDVRTFDAATLIGFYAFLNIVRRPAEKGKKEWSEIFAIRKRGETPPFMTRMQPGFTPDWITKAIAKQLPDPAGSHGGARQAPGNQGTRGQQPGPQNMTGRQPNSTGRYQPPDNRTDF